MSKKKVVIIGGGVTGLLAAHELDIQGFDVMVLEKGDIGNGSSFKSAACVRMQFSTEENILATLLTIGFYEQIKKHFPNASDGILRQNGYLYPFWNWHEGEWEKAQSQAVVMEEHGVPVELLSTTEALQRFPFLNPDHLQGARFCNRDGFIVPELLLRSLQEGLQERGVNIVTNCEVTGAVYGSSGMTGLQTSKGLFEADVFVNATNAFTRMFLKAIKPEMPEDSFEEMYRNFPYAYKRYLYFLNTSSVDLSIPLNKWPMTVFPSRVYCRPDSNKLLLFARAHNARKEPEFIDEFQSVIEPPFQVQRGSIGYGYQLLSQLHPAIPELAELGQAEVKAVTAGYYAQTPDLKHIIGPDPDPMCPNLYHVVGGSGHGIMTGVFAAKAVTAMVMTEGSAKSIETEVGTISLESFMVKRSFDSKEENFI